MQATVFSSLARSKIFWRQDKENDVPGEPPGHADQKLI